MALDDLTPIPYWLAVIPFTLVLFRQINQKIRHQTAPGLEHRRSAYMVLVVVLLLTNLVWGICVSVAYWSGDFGLWNWFRQPAGVALVRMGEAIAGWILFYFYWVDRWPKQGD